MQAAREKRDGNTNLGEVVVVAAIEDPLPVWRRAQVVVCRIGRGHVVKVVEFELLKVDGVDGLAEIVATDMGPITITSPGSTNTCVALVSSDFAFLVRPIMSIFKSATTLARSIGGNSVKYCGPSSPFSSPTSQ